MYKPTTNRYARNIVKKHIQLLTVHEGVTHHKQHDKRFQIGGQCACKRYVTGHRCDRCVVGYDNIRESDPDGCSKGTETSTSSTPLTSLTTLTSLVTSTSLGTPTSLVTPTSSKKSITLTLSLPTIIACSAVVVTVVVVIIVSVVCVRRRRRGPPQSRKYIH